MLQVNTNTKNGNHNYAKRKSSFVANATSLFRFVALMLFLLAGQMTAVAQCDNDTEAPVFDCPPISISCYADTSVAAIGTPLVTDNCDTDLQLSYQNFFTNGDCTFPSAAAISRIWTAVDDAGNIADCSQSIIIDRPNLNNVVFPADVNQTCNIASTDPSTTGEPMLDGVIIENGTYCDVSVGKADLTTEICGAGSYEIQRTWTVMDMCTNFMVTATQRIRITDDVDPVIVCPDNIEVDASPSLCSANVSLPAPTVTDNCNGAVGFSVATSFGAVGSGPHPFVPVGTHTVLYTAFDECNNESMCTITLTVRDIEEPVAVCEDFTIVSIPSQGQAIVMARTFDDGSADNCGGDVFFKVRRMTTGECNQVNGDDSTIGGYQEWFDDFVVFCCEDVESTNPMVIFRVYEFDPGSGPVNPAREAPGGDLNGRYTECMVEVQVQDKIDPQITCPPNLTIDCTSDLSDLSTFGTPEVFDNCSYVLDSIETVDVDQCGIGSVVRTFIATDPAGGTSACTQNILVINETPLDETGIIWPADYTSTECGADLEPTDLPPGFDEPIVAEGECAMVGISREDVRFDIAYPACYKILRTWQVLDWCNYDPLFPSQGGLFNHVQIIKVEDNDAPILTCPTDMVVPVSSNCLTAPVLMAPVTFDDCNPNVVITHDSPYANAQGANGSGVYPIGTTVVTFQATDECGNTAECAITIDIEDKTPPSPVCIVGLSVSLSDMDGTVGAIVPASTFDGGSFDNCSEGAGLQLFLRRALDNPQGPPSTSEVFFDCSDLGTQMIELWAVDQQGNSDFCLTYISVQDNNDECSNIPPGAGVAMIAGGITTETGEAVDEVMVSVTSGANVIDIFEGDGFFEFGTVPMGEDYTVSAQKNINPLNGVTTLDLVMISKHILGANRLDSPYKIIAADIDRSGHVSTLDIIKLRKLILNIETSLPNQNTSWRFVDARHDFSNPDNPFNEDFPEQVVIEAFEGDQLEADFVAVKVGDVNQSAAANQFDELEERTDQEKWNIKVANKTIKEGETVTLDFKASDLGRLLGYQFTLGFNVDAIEFEDLIPGNVPGLTEHNFGFSALEDGFITTSWNSDELKDANEEMVLFSLTVTAKEATQVSELFFINSRYTVAEAYKGLEEINTVSLQYLNANDVTDADGFILYQNRPNPFTESTTIGFHLPEAGEVNFTIFNAAGQQLLSRNAQMDPGYHEMDINAAELNEAGILYYRLETSNMTATKKMIMTEK